jgi:hypothetical protein
MTKDHLRCQSIGMSRDQPILLKETWIGLTKMTSIGMRLMIGA